MSNEDKIALEQNTAAIRCRLVVKATADLPEIVLTEDNAVKSWEYTDERLVPDKGFIGHFVARTLNGELQNVSDDFNLDGREIDFQFGVVRMNDHITTYYSLGSFIVVDPSDDDVRDSTKFETMDYAKKFNQTFDGNYRDENFPESYNDLMGLNTPEGQPRVVTPVTALWVAKYACAQVGVELATENFRNSNFEISQNPFQEDNSCRDVIKAVAQLALSWARIGWDNRCYIDFDIKSSEDVDELNVIDNNQYFTLEKQSTYGPINRIVWGMENIDGESYILPDNQSISENGEHNLYIYDNPFTYTYELRVQAAQAASALFGLTYEQLKTETVGHPWLIGTEFIDIKDMNDGHNYLYPFNRVLKYNGHIRSNIESIGETNVDDTLGYTNNLEKLVRKTAVIVNKQEGTIDSLVTDMYDENGLVQGNFTTIHQDITQVVTNVQNSGGNNLLKNSVMFAYDSNGNPADWDTTGQGQLITQSNTESRTAGCISGHSFTLLDKTASQTVLVKADSDSIPEDEKTYYSFGTNIKKSTTGTCYVKIYNSNEEYTIALGVGQDSFYGNYEIRDLLPKENYYTIEFYGSADSDATFTDNMFSLGRYKTQWQQASGEIMNTQVNINTDGVLVKSSVYDGDYTVMSPLEFAGYANINGVKTRVFTLNKDVTEVDKLKSKNGISMPPIKIVPITTGARQGWAFVPTTEEV